MKKRFLIITVILLLFAALALAGCDLFGGDDDDDDDFPSGKSSYTITFKNYDGSVLQSGKVDKGELPQFTGATPQRPSTAEFEYVFTGWSPQIVEATKAATYTAQFDAAAFRYEGGDGTESNPYIILNAQQLTSFADQVNDGEGYENKYFILGADIDLKGEEWTPIGKNYDFYFSGNFDGNGFTVENFVITSDLELAGLFGYNVGAVKNIGLTGFTIDVSSSSYYTYAGGLVGYNDGGEITNCYATGNVSATASSSAYAGGLVGYNDYYSEITNCYATGDVSITSDSDSDTTFVYAGGLVGGSLYSSVITNCYATGDISATSSVFNAYASGLVGSNSGTITNCYATGDISATASSYADAGGLVGSHFGTITNCYAVGNVSLTVTSDDHFDAFAGGLVGFNSGTITDCYASGNVSLAAISDDYSDAFAGGLVGYNNNGSTITNCYATGNVSATASSSAYAGGLVGDNNAGTITDCYATGDVSATSFATKSYTSPTKAGGLVGINASGGTITNCYRYDGQTLYRKEYGTEYDTADNDWGEPCSKANLNSVSFYTNTLEWDADVWDFSALNFDLGRYPTLKGQ